jgi:hypothetical protein
MNSELDCIGNIHLKLCLSMVIVEAVAVACTRQFLYHLQVSLIPRCQRLLGRQNVCKELKEE